MKDQYEAEMLSVIEDFNGFVLSMQKIETEDLAGPEIHDPESERR